MTKSLDRKSAQALKLVAKRSRFVPMPDRHLGLTELSVGLTSEPDSYDLDVHVVVAGRRTTGRFQLSRAVMSDILAILHGSLESSNERALFRESGLKVVAVPPKATRARARSRGR